jgi:hypothetical protein
MQSSGLYFKHIKIINDDCDDPEWCLYFEGVVNYASSRLAITLLESSITHQIVASLYNNKTCCHNGVKFLSKFIIRIGEV